MTIIVEPDPTTARAIASAVGPGVHLLAIEELKAHLDTSVEESAVILGPSVNLRAAVAFADTYRVMRPALSVILVRDSVDTHVLAEALRSGMREVSATADAPSITQAVRRAQILHEAMTAQQAPADTAYRGNVITVFSAKGGVGKTTVATNLAMALADQGTREVCLVDLDLAFGDVAITLQVFPTRTIADAVQMQPNLDLDGLESLLTPYRDGVSALVAPVQPDAQDTISAQLVGRILELLRERFAYIVVDTPPAFDDQVLQAFDLSDQVLLIATPDVPALKNLKIAFETLNLLNYPREQCSLVLNRADAKVGITADEASTTLAMPITCSIPSSRDVPASINRGEPIVVSEPRHSVSVAIKSLAALCLAASGSPDEDELVGAGHDGGKRRASRFARKGRN
ncbi:MAG: P-loop NTPase [Nocardioidaceae bacterium]|nr:P-loop NTPase [Nocardioidaceae bacterium]